MSRKNSTALTDEQKGQICGILSVGCDRETAANFVGCTTADIQRAMQQDVLFAAHVRRTEAASELTHMRTVQEAVRDPKNWRASVWWLEMRSPERFKPRSPSEVTMAQVEEFLNVLTNVICEEIASEADRQRVVERMNDALRALEEQVRAAPLTVPDSQPRLPNNSQATSDTVSDSSEE
jgi:hypothetical protein